MKPFGRTIYRTLTTATILLAVFLLFARSPDTKAAINPLYNFKGKVTDTGGVRVADGTYDLSFGLYTQAMGGATIWSESLVATTTFSATISGSTVNPATITYNYAGASATTTLRVGQHLTLTGSSSAALIVDFDTSANTVTVAGVSPVWPNSGTINNRPRVSGGVLDVNLGAVSSLSSLDFNQTYYLEVTFNGEVMRPRKLIASAPQAFNAARLNGLPSSSFLNTTDNITVTGEWNFNNKVAIATSSANNALTVTQSGGGKILELRDASSAVLSVLASGYVGIGTSTPAARLTVYGDMFMEGVNRYISFGTTTGSSGYGLRDNSGVLQYRNLGGAWSNIGSVGGMNDITDVTITSADYGDLIMYNGSEWVDTPTSSLAINLANTTGTLTVAKGGTGTTTFAANAILFATTTNVIGEILPGLNGQVLSIVSGRPAWSSTAPSAPHEILSTFHSDATPGTVVRGDLITGQGASATWSRLALGTNGYVLYSNGTDATWTATSSLGLAAYSHTHAAGDITSGTLALVRGGTATSSYAAANKLLRYNGSYFVTSQYDETDFATSSHVHTGVYQPIDSTLTSLAAYNTNGIMVQTAADTFTGRTLATSSNKIIILNPDGVAGNPTFDVSESQLTLSNLGGILSITKGGTGTSTAPSYGQLLLGNAAGGYDLKATSTLGLESAFSVLSIAKGGTGTTTFSANALLFATTTNVIGEILPGTEGYALVMTGGRPTWSSTVTGSSHNILSVSHSDTIATTTLVRGDILTVQGATPKWNRLALGVSGQVLRSDGTDVYWADVSGLGTGTVNPGTAGQIAYYAADGTAVNGTSTIFITPVGNFAIGTSSASSLLTVGATSSQQFLVNNLGVVTAGTWQGSPIGVGYGGTGTTTFSANAILFATTTNVISQILPGSNGQVLSIVSGRPAWSSTAPSAPHEILSTFHSDATPGTVVRGDLITGQGASATWTRLALGTNGYVLRSDGTDIGWSTTTAITALGAVTAGTWQAGIINVPYGGTGSSTLTANGVLYGDGTNAIKATAAGTNNYLLYSSGGTPSWIATSSLGLASSSHLHTGVYEPAFSVLSLAKGGTATSSYAAANKLLRYNGSYFVTSQYDETDFATSSHVHTGVYQPIDSTLTSLAAYNQNGIIVQTAADTFAGRTLATSSNKIIILNPDGVAGNPTFDVSESQLTLSNLGGILSITKGGTGTSTAPSYGQLLLGNAAGGYDLKATSTLGLESAFSVLSIAKGGTGSTTLYGLLRGNGASAVQTVSGTSGSLAYWSAVDNLGSTSTLAVNLGGTGLTSYTVGDLLYATTTTQLDKLAIGTSGQVLSVNPSGQLFWTSTAASTPHALLSSYHSDTTAAAVVRGDLVTGQGASATWTRLALGTNGYVLYSNGTDATWTATSTLGLEPAFTTLGIAKGGTGLTTLTDAGRLLYSTSATGLTTLASSTYGTVLMTQSTGYPGWTATSSLGLGSGTVGAATLAGQVPYYAGAGTTLTATSSLFINSNGYIGIGTTSPTERLTIDGGNILHNFSGDIAIKSNIDVANNDIYIVGKYAYLAGGASGLLIYDVANPKSPASVGSYNTSGDATGVFVAGKYAYVADWGSGLQIIDVSNPKSPTLVGAYDTNGSAMGVYVSGKYAYVADGNQGMKIIDISNPTYPVQVGATTAWSNSRSVYVTGSYAYLVNTNGLQIIDISNPAGPVAKGLYSNTGALGVYVSGKYAYLAGSDGSNKFQIINIEDINNPTYVSGEGTYNYGDIFVSGKYAYLINATGPRITVINISSSTAPSLATSISAASCSISIFVSGKYAYCGSNTGGFAILDINGIETPSLYAGSVEAGNLNVYNDVNIGNNLYVINGINAGFGGIAASGPLSISATNSPSAILGNVGIGTSSPSAMLTVGATLGSQFLVNSSGVVTAGTWQGSPIGVSYGGTGSSTLTANGILYGAGTGAIQATAQGTNNYLLYSANGIPSWIATSSLGLGSGTVGAATLAGQVPYYAGVGTTLTATSSLFINSNGYIGIGTTAPSQLFTVGSDSLNNFTVNSNGVISVYGPLTSSASINARAQTSNYVERLWGISSDNYLETAVESGINGIVQVGTWRQGAGAIPYKISASDVRLFVGANGDVERMRVTGTGVGIGTTSPSSKLTVWGSGTGSNMLVNFVNSASTTLFSLLENGTISMSSSTATTTIMGGLSVGGGALQYDLNTGVTSIDNINLGSLNFDTDAGVVSWVDMPIATTTAGIMESYTAQLDGNPLFTIYGETDGLGGIRYGSIGIGTTTPLAQFALQAGTSTRPLLDIASTTGASMLRLTATGNMGIGTNNPTYKFYVSGDAYSTGWIYGARFVDYAGGGAYYLDPADTNIAGLFAGNVGVGTTSPSAMLTVGATSSSQFLVNNVGVVTAGTWNGSVIGVGYGGTGTSTAPSYGQLLLGNNSSGYNLVATSSLGLGSGTVGAATLAGQVPYYAGAGTNLTATSALFIAADGNIGIGTDNPGSDLALSGSDIQSINLEMTSGADLTLSAGSAAVLRTNDGTNFEFGVYGGTNMIIAGSSAATRGFIGMGTTTPISKLDVYGNILAEGSNRYLNFGTATGTSGYGFFDNAGVMQWKNASGSWANFSTSTGAVSIGTAGQIAYYGTGGDVVSGTSSLFISPSTGFIGIGTTTPGAKLTVLSTTGSQLRLVYDSANYTDFIVGSDGKFTIDTNSSSPRGSLVTIGDNSSENAGLIFAGSSTPFYLALDNADGALKIGTSTSIGSSTVLTILKNGKVGIGTTTPTATLSLQPSDSSTSNYVLKIYRVTAGGEDYVSLRNDGQYIINTDVQLGGGYGLESLSSGASIHLQTGGSGTGNIDISTNNSGTGRHITLVPYGGAGVGIGTTSPSQLLTVGATSSQQFLVNSLGVVTGGTWQGSPIGVTYGGTGTSTAPSYGQLLLGNNSSGYNLVATSSLGLMSGTAIGAGTTGQIPYYAGSGSNLTATSALFIAANGNIGISTVEPSATLHLDGTATELRIEDDDNPIIKLYDDTVYEGRIQTLGSNMYAGSLTGSLFLGSQAGNGAITIHSGGNVGIGTTSPLALLDVYGSAILSGSNRYLNFGTATGTGGYGFYDNAGVMQWKNASGSWTNFSTSTGAVSVGTAGQIAYYGTGGDVVSGTSSLFISPSTGFIGIGTTTPANKLTVVSTAGSQLRLAYDSTRYTDFTVASNGELTINAQGGTGGSIMTIGDNSSNNTGLIFAGSSTPFYLALDNADGALKIGTSTTIGSSTLLTIMKNGNVGIGNTNPNQKLDVNGLINVPGNQPTGTYGLIFNNNTSFGLTNSGYTYALSLSAPESISITAGQQLSLASGASFDILINAGGSEKMRVKNTGLIGIGTTSPSSKLTVYGDAFLEGSNRYLNFGTATGTGGYGFFDNGGTLQFKNSSGSWANISTSTIGLGYTGWIPYYSATSSNLTATSSLFIAANGNVGIGTTNPSSRLHVVLNPTVGAGSYSANPNVYLYNGGDHSSKILNLDLGDYDGNDGLPGDIKFLTLSCTGSECGGISRGAGIDYYANRRLRFITTANNADIMFYPNGTGRFIVANGNVGIGTTSPYAKLTVWGAGTGSNSLVNFVNSASTTVFSVLENGNLTSGGIIYATGGYAFSNDVDTGLSYISANKFALTTNNNYVLTVDGSGYVGIGTTSPSAMLTVGATLGSQFLVNSSGVVTAGTWQGSPVGVAYGGTGLTTLTDAGRLLYSTSATGLATLASSTYGTVLMTQSTGYPGWTATSSLGLEPAFSILGVSKGGTGSSTLTANGILYGAGTGAIQATAQGTNNYLLYSANGTPSWIATSSLGLLGSNITASLSANYVPKWTGSVFNNSLIYDTGTYLGIGTTSPSSKLTVWGAGTGSNMLVNFVNSASTTLFSLLENGTISMSSSTATTTIMGGLSVGGGALQYDLNTGVTSIDSIDLGSMNFDTDSGIITWIDMPVATTTAGIVQSYTAKLDGNPMLTVYAETDGSGGIKNRGIGIGTTTPLATFAIQGNASSSLPLFDVATSTGASMFRILANGKIGIGTTSPWAKLSVEATDNASIPQFVVASSSATSLVVDKDGKVGIGTSSPYARFSIVDSGASGLRDVFVISTSTTGAIFKVDSYGQVWTDNGTLGTPADYAEYFYTTDTDLQSGEAVCVDVENKNAVKRCLRQADNDIIGIVSTRPLIVGNAKPEFVNNKNYVMVAMLGQIPAKVSAENGPVRPGDSLTSAKQVGFVARAEAGDSTVGVALEALDEGTGVINVLISRRNKSLTVEQVEDKVTERIAAMKIEDEVRLMISSAINNLGLSSQITPIVNEQLALLKSSLTVSEDEQTGRIIKTETDLSALTDRLAALEQSTDLRFRNYDLRIAELTAQVASSTILASDSIKIDANGNIKIGRGLAPPAGGAKPLQTGEVAIVEIDAMSDMQTALVVRQAGEGNIAEFVGPEVSVVTIAGGGEVKVVGTLGVDGRILVCSGGVCPAGLDENVDATLGDIGVEGTIVAGAFSGYCARGFVWAPGSTKYGTMPGFCVMDRIARMGSVSHQVATEPPGGLTPISDASSTPWVNISQGEAAISCQSLGDNYHLLTENEWLTIAENAIRIADNDIDKATPGLQLATSSVSSVSHPVATEPPGGLATLTTFFTLSNGNRIYDLVGALAEWTDQNITRVGLPTLANSTPEAIGDWQEYYQISDYRGLAIAPPYYYTAAQNGTGRILIGDGTANLRGFVRGYNGLYSLDLSNPPTLQSPVVGFRCVK